MESKSPRASQQSYAFKVIEERWQRYWKENNSTQKFEHALNGRKQYILEMLPYPSGRLHMGHVRNYSIGDAIARFKRLQGYGILHPMGWDAFGLPAENAAMQNKAHPKTWTLDNIAEMKRQLNRLGFSYNWEREVTTCLPDYYHHQQKLFKAFYQKGLLEQKESWVNWDPIEQSVLANEQVINGKGWRSGAIVEKKLLRQWSVKITAYAQELLDDLTTLTGWPEKVVKMQENWIGRSEGALVHFQIKNRQDYIPVFTTRPDTLFGCSFIAIAPTHPLTVDLAKDNTTLQAFIEECQKMDTTEQALSTAEKKGFLTSLKVIHPFDTSLEVPVYVANFVLMDYGTGAVFGCPAHDERDFDFAKLYNLPIPQVVQPLDKSIPSLPYTGSGTIIHSDFLNGLTVEKAKKLAIQRLKDLQLGDEKITYRLRDWLVSRQRYWGCPIPVVHCDDCGIVLVPDEQLPVELPDDVSFDRPGNPLEHHPNWKNTTCPQCQKPARRETDTLDTFVDSSWYFLRYTCATSPEAIVSSEANTWCPVEWYIGGIEHAVMHLLYARFFTKALRDLGYVNFGEPFKNLLTQGMVCHETYQDSKGQWLYPDEVEKISNTQWIVKSTKEPATVGGSIKMSKSKKNVIDPLEILASYGADVARLFIMSDTPPEKDFDWNTEALDGCWRYLNRIYRLFDQCINHLNESSSIDITKNTIEPLKITSHQYLKKIIDAFNDNGFNKAIAFHREFCKHIEEHYQTASKETIQEALRFFVMMISPITPHLAYELYERLTGESLDHATLPVVDEELIHLRQITIAVQVNGKLRGTFNINPDQDETVLESHARKVTTVQPYLEGKEIRKIVVVKNRLVSFLV